VSLAALLGFVNGNHVGYGPACCSNGRSGSLVMTAHARARLDVFRLVIPRYMCLSVEQLGDHLVKGKLEFRALITVTSML
jgi:hypothetical protein